MEKELQFELKKTSAVAKGDRYRAVLHREKTLGLDEVLKECIADSHLNVDLWQLKLHFLAVLDSMIRHTAEDGCCRRIDDYFTLRLDIKGGFDRFDAPFDPKRHRLTLNLQSLKKLRQVVRKELPVNQMPHPEGRFERVGTLGGEAGMVEFGKDIVIEGHELTLSEHDCVQMLIELPEGERTYDCALKENTYGRLVVGFPIGLLERRGDCVGKQVTIIRMAFSENRGPGHAHGRRAKVLIVD